MTFLYDNTYPGFLSAVFEVYRLKLGKEVVIQSEDSYQEQLFAQPVVIEPNSAHAERLEKGLTEKSKSTQKLCYRVFLSEHERREEVLLHFIRRVFAEGAQVEEDLTDDRIVLLKRLNQQMGREIHRMHAFVRFQETPDGLFAAVIDPDFDVLPLAHQHFIDRYTNQHWLIYDTRRHYGLLWDKKAISYVTFSANDHRQLRHLNEAMLADVETDYQRLWQTYFHAVDIPERRNLKLHLQHVPKRYWKYLVEKWDKV